MKRKHVKSFKIWESKINEAFRIGSSNAVDVFGENIKINK